jgi:hypothetical protein
MIVFFNLLLLWPALVPGPAASNVEGPAEGRWEEKKASNSSLELSAAYFQSVNSVFLSQQISQQYFQPLIFSQANMLTTCWWRVLVPSASGSVECDPAKGTA